MDLFSLEGKVAVITGAASGIGAATARRFAAARAKVVLVWHHNDAGPLASELGGLSVQADVTIEADIERVMETAVQEFGRLDVVINNAGGVGLEVLTADMTEEGVDAMLATDLKGKLWGVKHGARRMKAGGSIVSTSSYLGLFGMPYYTSYVVPEFAVVGLTKTAALELAPQGIRVNCVCPGSIDFTGQTRTPGTGSDFERAAASIIHPLGRMGRAEEVAALFHFLASDDSSFVTGQAISVDGGLSAGFSLKLLATLQQLSGPAAEGDHDVG